MAWGAAGVGEGRAPAGLSNVVAIAAGGSHSLALKADGTVVAWGRNDYGQTNTPLGLTNVVAIAAGGFQTMALKADGSLVTWGDNSLGQPNVPSAVTNVVGIASGSVHSLALVDSVWPLATTVETPSVSIGNVYFRQTGLIEQVVRVSTAARAPFPLFVSPLQVSHRGPSFTTPVEPTPRVGLTFNTIGHWHRARPWT